MGKWRVQRHGTGSGSDRSFRNWQRHKGPVATAPSPVPLAVSYTQLQSGLIVIAFLLCGLLAAPLIAQDKADLAKLAAQLGEKDPKVRQSAVEALGQSSDPAVVDLLISALRDDNQEVRSAAALALGQTGAAKGIEPLAKMLRSSLHRDRRSATVALGTIGGEQACEALLPL